MATSWRSCRRSAGADVVELTREAIDPAVVIAGLEDTGCGALVSFVGRVRDDSRGRRVTRLEYEAYDEMAVAVLERLIEEARRRWQIGPVAIVHRLGTVMAGEETVVVAVASAHRQAAFEACRWLVDQMKADVPIWKREVYADGGAEWVGGEPEPPEERG